MSKIEYPRVDVSEAVFYHTIEKALCPLRENRIIPQMRHVWEPLSYLAMAEYPGDTPAVRQGDTYKSLAHVAHRMGMSDEDRKA
jgi:hypothetical protein